MTRVHRHEITAEGSAAATETATLTGHEDERPRRPGPVAEAGLAERPADGRSLVGDDSHPGPWRGHTGGGTVLAFFQVVRPGRAVGEHDGQPGRAFLSPGRFGCAQPRTQGARIAG